MSTPFKLKDKSKFDFGNKGKFDFRKKHDMGTVGWEPPVDYSDPDVKKQVKKLKAEKSKKSPAKVKKDPPKKSTGITVGDAVKTVFSSATGIPTEGRKKVRKKVIDVAKKTKKRVWDKAKKVWNYKLVD